MASDTGTHKARQRIEALHVPGGALVKLEGDLDENFDRKTYVEYAARAALPDPPSLVDGMLSGAVTPGTGSKVGAAGFRIEKDIGESIAAFWFSGNLDQSANFRRVADGVDGLVAVITDRIV